VHLGAPPAVHHGAPAAAQQQLINTEPSCSLGPAVVTPPVHHGAPAAAQQQLINTEPSCSLGPAVVTPPVHLGAPPAVHLGVPPSAAQQQLINTEPSCSLEPAAVAQQQLINSEPSCSLESAALLSPHDLPPPRGAEPIRPSIVPRLKLAFERARAMEAPQKEPPQKERKLTDIEEPPETPILSKHMLDNELICPTSKFINKKIETLTPRTQPPGTKQPTPEPIDIDGPDVAERIELYTPRTPRTPPLSTRRTLGDGKNVTEKRSIFEAKAKRKPLTGAAAGGKKTRRKRK
jgi:hypothetical protein